MSLNNIEEYWDNRYNKQGFLTVGNYQNLKEQDQEYKEKQDFIFTHCPTNLRTLDYGCGVGRYSRFFDYYIGIDITKKAIELAKQYNPDAQFYNTDKINFEFELFFTATVLQHCSDKIVNDIFNKISDRKNITLCLYENSTKGESEHVKGRDSYDFGYFKIIEYKKYKHVIHNEEHTLHLIKT